MGYVIITNVVFTYSNHIKLFEYEETHLNILVKNFPLHYSLDLFTMSSVRINIWTGRCCCPRCKRIWLCPALASFAFSTSFLSLGLSALPFAGRLLTFELVVSASEMSSRPVSKPVQQSLNPAVRNTLANGIISE